MVEPQNVAPEMERLFLAKDAAGEFVIDDEATRVALGVFALTLAQTLTPEGLPPALLQQVEHVLTRAQVAEADAPEAIRTKIDGVVDATPGARAAVDALHRLAREAAASGDTAALTGALGRVLGKEERRGVLDSGPRPEGTVPAGPAARFNLDKKGGPKGKKT